MEEYIKKIDVLAEIKRRYEFHKERNRMEDSAIQDVLYGILNFINTLEVKEVVAEQECICNEALNRIIGGSWNVICPVNKLGLKNGDKVKVIIEAQKGE